MNAHTFRQQFITDTQGNAVAVILPIEEYQRIAPLLQRKGNSEQEKLALLKQAAQDPLFFADLQESMNDFKQVDSEWWESET